MKILVVGMVDSVHLGRWLEQFEASEHTFFVFPSSPHRRVHPKIARLMTRHPQKFCLPSFMILMSLPLWVLDRLMIDWLRGAMLALYARRNRPDLVHVLEFQNAGYLFLRGLSLSQTLSDANLLLTPYGSDIFWFEKFPRHLTKIRRLLDHASGLSCECRRDEVLATSHGFTGRFMPRIPAFGGIVLKDPKETSNSRGKLMVKGYQNKWGQAANAISAIQVAAPHLKDLEVHFYSCNLATVWKAKKLARETHLSVVTHLKGRLSHEEVQSLFADSVLYIGLSKSDGISASMIEAMANGAIPIQSNTSCSDEWLSSGVGGFLVDYDDIATISRHIIQIVCSTTLQEAARQRNYLDLKMKLSLEKTREAAEATYREFDVRD